MSTPPTSKLDIIQKMVLATIGSPVLPAEIAFDYALDVVPALIEYYKFLPIKAPLSYTITNSRELEVPFADVIGSYSPGSVGSFFYVGVIHCAIRSQIGQNAFNQNLLGLNVGVPIANPMENLQMATMIDMSTGDVYYEEDEFKGVARFILGGSGNLSIIFGLGCWDGEKLPYRHLRNIADLCGIYYYTRLIAIRETGTFSAADFKISTVMLNKALDECKVRSKEYLENAAYMAISYG
jgi:hypothetical protein